MTSGVWVATRALWRLARTVTHVLHGAAIVWLRWPSLDEAGRRARIAWWAAKVLRLLGLRLRVEGQFRVGATMLLANHVSWLDIMAVHAVCPRARFVAKADVRHWPLVGWLSASVGTLFIERERKRDALRVVHQIAQALGAGDMVGVFPEGTTGDGLTLLPFHGNLLQAAISTDVPVQGVALRYSQPGLSPSAAALWVGDTTLLASLWAVACASELTAHLVVLPPHITTHAERRALAQHMFDQIEAALRPQGRSPLHSP